MQRAAVALATLVVIVAAPAFADPPRFPLDGHRLLLPTEVVFVTGGDALGPESDAALAHVAAYLADKPAVTSLRIEVHSDTALPAAMAQAQSERRAYAVARALVAKGAACARLVPVGFGANKPVADNASVDGRAQNRRVWFINAALRGRPLGGMPVDGGGVVAGDACAPPKDTTTGGR
jgi:OOP family OmpA-OmpF porin